MDTTEAIRVAEECIKIMADGELADFERLVHAEAVNHEDSAEPPECRQPGPTGYYATARWLRTAFAELAYDIHYVVTEGDLVAVNSTMSGRHVAPFAVYDESGAVDSVFPPTGKTFAVSQSHWLRIKDGQVVDHWANRDDIGQAKQLGWVPPSPLYLFKMARAKARVKRGV